jgi:hypothetical protein
LLDLACVDMFYSTEPIKHAAVCRDAVKQACCSPKCNCMSSFHSCKRGNCHSRARTRTRTQTLEV